MEEDRRRCTTTGIFCGRTGLFVLMTGYAFFGALLFKTLEGNGNESSGNGVPLQVQKSREDCLRELWLITERLNVLYEKNWTRLVTEQLKRFERAVVEYGKVEENIATDLSPAPQWTFGGALLYSLTLLTTVGYGRLSPRTAMGKVVAVIYALIGVPLMLILLSALGAMLASGARKIYSKLCCQQQQQATNPTVGYHKAPSSPSKFYSNSNKIEYEDSASIQIASTHSTPTNHCKPPVTTVPKRALLATVRASHRQMQVRQLLTECPAHHHHQQHTDIEDMEENECGGDQQQQHDTPSRVPLIYRQPPETILSSHHPPVPATLVLFIFVAYVAAGATALVSTSGWGLLDAVYFCFIAVSTIGIGDKLPQSADAQSQMQLLACCLYIFVGLVIVAMCFSLVHEEISTKCKHIAHNMGLVRH